MTDKQILINLVTSLGLADRMGDAITYAIEALKQAGIEPPNSIWDDGEDSALAMWLAREHGGVTVYGTSVLDE